MNRRELFQSLAAIVTGPAVASTAQRSSDHSARKLCVTDFTVAPAVTYTLELNGRAIAEAVVQHLPDVVRRHGLL